MKSLLKVFNNLSMLWKFSVIYFLLIMVPTLLISFNYYSSSTRSVIDDSDTLARQSISQIKQSILDIIKNCEYVANEISYDTEIITFLDSSFNFAGDQVDYLNKDIQVKIRNIKNLNRSYYKARIYTTNSTIPEISDFLYRAARIQNRDYFKEIQNSYGIKFWGKEKEAEEYFNVKSKSTLKVLPLYTPILSLTTNKLIGVFEIDIMRNDFTHYLKGLKFGENGYFALVNQDDEILFSGNTQLEQYLNFSGLSGEKGLYEFNIEGKQYRLVFDTISELSYKILAVLPKDELLNQISGDRNVFTVLIIFGTIGVFFIIYMITGFMFKRFKVMIKMMKRIQKGEFNVRIDVESKDEVGELSQSFNSMALKLEELISSLIEKETARRDAEIKALQSQVNPHFLYNVLENLRMECETREEYDISETLTSLGGLFRYSMKWDHQIVTLKQELQHVMDYIMVMKSRYKGKITFISDIPDNMLNLHVIKMLLQPIVENCFRHAFVQKEGPWIISIHGYVCNSDLCIEVEDNGNGISDEKLRDLQELLSTRDCKSDGRNKGKGIGLLNTNIRIKIQYGEQYGIQLESQKEVGTKVCICLPVNDKALALGG